MAHAQGLLTHPSLNVIQMWALQYFLYMERRIQVDDTMSSLEVQCYNLNLERWQQLYQNQGPDWGQAFDGEAELPITDPTDLDSWYANLERPRGMTGAETARVADPTILGMVRGSGRRV